MMKEKGQMIDLGKVRAVKEMKEGGINLPRLTRNELLERVNKLDKISIEFPDNVAMGFKLDLLGDALELGRKLEDIVLFSEGDGILYFTFKDKDGNLHWENRPNEGYLPVEVVTDKNNCISDLRAGGWLD